MLIDLDFPKNHQLIGKHMHSDGEHYHFVWGPGKTAEAAENEEVKSSYAARGEEIVPGTHMLGMRLWRRVHINMPSAAEFQEIIDKTFPVLGEYLPVIMKVYTKCLSLYQRPTFASASKISIGRPLSPRDLMKWCRRLNAQFCLAGLSTGQEPIAAARLVHDCAEWSKRLCGVGIDPGVSRV